ncbi:hypothetical protein BI344_02190 [Chromobacterium sphagni]|uniref:Uncharacterized protein n=1 Tax=Chromobacterium sphagni TaxID=1903179 RepID=A0ABX3CG97_9NEIS|nr:hypothetical protein BI344_02190 [Chromobacterium sphagni]
MPGEAFFIFYHLRLLVQKNGFMRRVMKKTAQASAAVAAWGRAGTMSVDRSKRNFVLEKGYDCFSSRSGHGISSKQGAAQWMVAM